MEKCTLDLFYRMRYDAVLKTVQWCMEIGLMAPMMLCPVCPKKMTLRSRLDINDKCEWICQSRTSASSHRIKRSVRIGSYFEKSNLPITDILLMTHMFVLQLNHSAISNELNVTYHTVCDWHNLMREICLSDCEQSISPIGGIGLMVDMDESKLSNVRCNCGRGVEGKWVYGGVERGTKKCFFKVVEKTDKGTLLDIIKTFIQPGTTIYSECWNSYDCLEDEEFQNLTANHSLLFKNPENRSKNSTEGRRSAIKKRTPRRVITDQFAEYMWRKKHSDSVDLTREFLLTAAKVYSPGSPMRDFGPPEDETEGGDNEQREDEEQENDDGSSTLPQ